MNIPNHIQAIIVVIGGLFSVFLAEKIVRRYWPVTGKWGMPKNVSPCPFCGSPPALFRKPASRHQLLWGGWTCSKCGNEMDKYGKPVGAEKK
jgi:ribosomal protein L37AE/L43A